MFYYICPPGTVSEPISIKATIKISPYLVHRLRKSRDLKLYAVWLYLKGLYRNSCIFHYNITSLAKKAGLSRTMIRKYVSIYLRHEWCYMHAGNLVFRKHTQLPDKRERSLCLQLIDQHVKNHTVAGYLSALEAFLLKDAQRKQQHARLKPYGKDMQIRLATRETLQGLPFTVKRASKLLKVSTSTASRTFRKLALQGWFNRTSFPIQRFAMTLKPLMGGMDEVLGNHNSEFTLTTYKGFVYKCYPAILNWLPEVVGIKGCCIRKGIVTTNN